MASGSQNMTTYKAKQLVNTYGGEYTPVWVDNGILKAITAGTTGQFYRGDNSWSNTLANDLYLSGAKALYINSTGAIAHNGSNLWIGATATNSNVFTGSLYLNGGLNSSGKRNRAAYLSLGASNDATTGTNYPIVHKEAAGSSTNGIYVDSNGKTIAMSYSLSATVNAASVKNTFAYYSGTHEISSYPRIRNIGSARYPIDLYVYNDAGNLISEIWYDAGDATNVTRGQWAFMSESPNSTNNTGTTGKYEYFYLPNVDTGRTANAGYAIRTSKDNNYTVSNATTAASCTGNSYGLLSSNTSQAAESCYDGAPGLHFWRYNGSSGQSGGDGWIAQWSWNAGSVGGQIYLDDNPSYTIMIRGRNSDENHTFNAWKRIQLCDGTGASGTWGISITGKAGSVDWANTGHPSTFPPSSHTHYELATIGDKRNENTTPNTYANRLIFQGLKTNTKINSPYTDTYSYLVGLRGWSDSSGGNSHELAFNGNGIYRRQGATTAWGNWFHILDSNNYTSYTVTKTGSGASGTWGISVTGNAATATRINDNLAQATSDANRNIWVSSTTSADGIPNYVTTFTMNPSTKTLHIPSGGRVDANGGALYLGNSGNQSWVYVQDMASQASGTPWKLTQTGVLTCVTVNAALNGNATSATKATQDGNGNNIYDNYIRRSGGGSNPSALIYRFDNSFTPDGNEAYFIVIKVFATIPSAGFVGYILGGYDVFSVYSNSVTTSRSGNKITFSSSYGVCQGIAIRINF